jgi:hypothetical protein
LSKDLPTLLQGTGLSPIGPKTDGSNPHEATRQDMPQETANKLDGLERHDFLSSALATMPPGKPHLTIGGLDETMVSQSDARRRAPQRVENLLGFGTGRFALHHPLVGVQWLAEVAKVLPVLPAVRQRSHAHLPLVMSLIEGLDTLAANHLTQGMNRKEEGGLTRHPAFVGRIQGTGGHETMEVDMGT